MASFFARDCTKTVGFFNRSFLTARIFRTTCATEKIYTSFESPEIQLSWARGTKDVAEKQSRHAHFNKNDWVSLKWAWRFYLGATASVLLAHTSWITGLSNEVYNLSVAQVVQEKLGKVRRTFVYRADLFWPQCRIYISNLLFFPCKGRPFCRSSVGGQICSCYSTGDNGHFRLWGRMWGWCHCSGNYLSNFHLIIYQNSK